MGIGITGYRNIRYLHDVWAFCRQKGHVFLFGDVSETGPLPRHEGHRDGCYEVEEEREFPSMSASNFVPWHARLLALAEAYTPRNAPKPFREFSDVVGRGCVGPETCARIAAEFSLHEETVFAALAASSLSAGEKEDFRSRYATWKDAFAFASDRGCLRSS